MSLLHEYHAVIVLLHHPRNFWPETRLAVQNLFRVKLQELENAKEGSYFDSLIEHPKTTYRLWGANCGSMEARSRPDREYIKATGLLHFCTNFNVYFPEKLKMHSSKALLYGTILAAQMFTALAAPSMANPPHDAEGKSSPKSNDPFANEAKGSETQVKGEIDEQLEKRQVWTRQPFENMAKYGRTSLQRSELPFIAKGTATGL